MNPRIKTLLKYIVPTVLSQCAFFLFLIIDGIFVGNGVGTDALGAVNLALPFVMVVGAVFMLTTIGGVTITAIRIGRKDFDGANDAFMNSLFCTLAVSAVFTLIGVFFTKPLAAMLGAGGVYEKMVTDYLFWYSLFTVPSALAVALQGFGRNDGAPVFVMVSTILSTMLNIFLDWLFVFPLRMGLKGAAIATGISQTVGFLIISVHFVMKRGVLRVRRFKLSGLLFKKVLKRGVPELLSQLTGPVMIYCMNLMLMRYIGEAGINAYSIICYIISFAYAVFFGVSEGLQPLFGRSYGDKNEGDLKFYYRAGLILSFGSSFVIYFLTILLGGPICKLFGADSETTDLAVKAIPLNSWSFIFAGLNTIISAYLYSTKRTKESAAVNVLRGFILSPICVFLLSMAFKDAIIWHTIGIAEALTFIAALLIVKNSEKHGVDFNKK
ncbi:MAG: MATE family efflux transporter [Clostridiales bacterium]|nr:MATE family efflux transporter [Clostridiales bacterium]HXK83982.1 MATE family efflux transporter [Clostridiales bacterium]